MSDKQTNAGNSAGGDEWFADKSISTEDLLAYAIADDSNPEYSLGPDSLPRQGVPRGDLSVHRHTSTVAYPGVQRDYRVYVPAQYDGSTPAALIVFLDGAEYLAEDFRAVSALDNLIAKGEIPLTVAVFVEAGEFGPGYPIFGGDDNRSAEFDSIEPTFVRFLTEELLPEALNDIDVSGNPRDRVIVGFSSGGNAAWTAAWQAPHHFGNVISHCGSFVDIRGGHNHAPRIRRSPRKPIRIWQQTGRRDAAVVFGDLKIANEDMAAALRYRYYDHIFVVGDGGHTLRHGGLEFPRTLRWIWRDHPSTASTY
ncbi:esterase family protein [Rhodococcus fascians]|nr:esterase family protein [Rhodococcus fascians]MBY3997810.1 esterase family protein [Rhodococcus fascians]MBY4002807.1 esterase family protein [Rhodococcus fascians]MBY4006798.1 esterase family protein [Rhodococcus fascians]MBY4019405.1 esterase family protein [Rhodococcus fascians]